MVSPEAWIHALTHKKSWRCDENENSDYGHPPPGLAIEQSRVSVKDEKADPYNFFREYVRLDEHEHLVSPPRLLSLDRAAVLHAGRPQIAENTEKPNQSMELSESDNSRPRQARCDGR